MLNLREKESKAAKMDNASQDNYVSETDTKKTMANANVTPEKEKSAKLNFTHWFLENGLKLKVNSLLPKVSMEIIE